MLRLPVLLELSQTIYRNGVLRNPAGRLAAPSTVTFASGQAVANRKYPGWVIHVGFGPSETCCDTSGLAPIADDVRDGAVRHGRPVHGQD